LREPAAELSMCDASYARRRRVIRDKISVEHVQRTGCSKAH
jgi:hypothetical protein